MHFPLSWRDGIEPERYQLRRFDATTRRAAIQDLLSVRYKRTVQLYDYVASANCYKVRLLLAQLGHAYERVPVDIFDGDTLTDDFARLNPLRSTPVLVLDDGRVLVESNAILWYLAHGTELLPVDPFEQAEVA